MKMVMIVVNHDDAHALVNALVSAGYAVTIGESKGGKLRQASQSLFVATEDEQLEAIYQVIRSTCRSEASPVGERERAAPGAPSSRTARVGGVIVFVWSIEQMLRL